VGVEERRQPRRLFCRQRRRGVRHHTSLNAEQGRNVGSAAGPAEAGHYAEVTVRLKPDTPARSG
jgi:hypothetical protein